MRPSDIMLVLPSRMASVCEVAGFVDEVIDSYGLSDDLQGNLLISLTEAVTNAIRHGNELDESKHVRVEVWRKRTKLRVVVADEGEGFSPRTVPDPTAPARIEKEGGRGVFLMRALSDEIRYFNEGRCVEMCYDYNHHMPPRKLEIASHARARA